MPVQYCADDKLLNIILPYDRTPTYVYEFIVWAAS